MQRLLYYAAILGLATVLVAVGGVEQGLAVDREGMTISPTSRHYEVDPGQKISDSFIILNDGTVPIDFDVYGSPYSVSNESYDVSYDSTSPRADAHTWLQLGKTNYHANVRDTTTVPYTMTIPANASPGGHYGIIFAETQAQGEANTTGVLRKKRLGVVLYVTVKGDVKQEGSVQNISIPGFQQTAPMVASVSYKNTGNSDFPVTVSYMVRDLFGNKKFDRSAEYYILPDTTRNIELAWDNAAWLGIYKASVTVKGLDRTDVKESYVIVMPFWFIFMTGFMTLLAAAYAYKRKRR